MSGRIERYARELAAKAARLEVPARLEDRFGRYRWDPVALAGEILGVESATRRSDGRPYQFDVLADLAAHLRVTVRSGHGVGKSTVAAWATLWWLLTRPLSRVVIVAPEFSRQVRAVLFSEIGKGEVPSFV